MKLNLIFTILSVCLISSNSYSYSLSCKADRTFGADYFQAKTNCELVLNGDAHDCQPGGSVWYCRCDIGCRGNSDHEDGHFTRTFGANYFQAKTNCELVLNGSANNCQPGSNGIWYCDCHY